MRRAAQVLQSLGICGDAARACKKLLVGVKRKTVPGRCCLMTAARVVAKDVGQGGGRGCWPGLWPRMLARVVAKVVGQGGGQGCWPGWRQRLLSRVVAEDVDQGGDAGRDCWPLARKEQLPQSVGLPYCAGKKF